MPKRTLLFVGVALLAAPSAVLLAVRMGPAGIPAAVAGCAVLAMAIGWPAGRRYAHRLAIAAGLASLVVTGYVVITGAAVGPGNVILGPIELGGLYLLLAAVARWTAPLKGAIVSGAVAWFACVVWLLRVTGETEPFIIISNLLAAGVFPTIAAAAGALPRFLEHRRLQLVAATRHEQRLELAQDLHDFVAHDLTGIVAQAQAARFARGDQAADLRDALERIESVGLAALETMDGFVQVLHTGESAPRSPRGVADIPGIVDRFRAEREPGAPVTLELDDGCLELPRQLQSAAYRVVVEGLTNVRRHAAVGCAVTVSVSASENGRVIVSVTNDLGTPAHGVVRSAGGTGLAALQDRVSAVGGRLESRQVDADRWRLEAILPTAGSMDGGR